MGLTSIDFSQIDNVENTPTGININKAIKFNSELQISNIPPTQENTSNIWFNKNTEELKIKINNTTYDLQPSSTLNNITISSNTTLNLNGKRGLINNLTISGTNTVLTVRTGAAGWSILEIQGNLTIDSGCTLNLIRVPLIVRGNMLGSGTISSPDGVNGGAGGIGGPGGSGGTGLGGYPGIIDPPYAGVAPTLGSPGWTNGAGGSAIPMPVEYEISSGSGGNGGQGTAGGGVGGSLVYNPFLGRTEWYSYGGYSGNGYPGGSGYLLAGGGGGGVGGPGASVGSPTQTGGAGGPGAYGNPGNPGNPASPAINLPYIGTASPSTGILTAPSAGQPGGATFGGAGGPGFSYSGGSNDPPIYGSPGQQGGTGGNGTPGGSTGGAHISILCIGTIASTVNIRPGKGGINGGISSSPKAQTGSLWLFSQYGIELSPNASLIDITGIGPAPNGPIGVVNRISTSDTTSVNNFFRDILYNSNGLTPAKDIISIIL